MASVQSSSGEFQPTPGQMASHIDSPPPYTNQSIEPPMTNGSGPSADGDQGADQPTPGGRSGGKKKVNPLVDLIETEKTYVDLLAAIIRRVAAAWSRANFPPPQLDAVFRSVEVVYRSNRALLAVCFHFVSPLGLHHRPER